MTSPLRKCAILGAFCCFVCLAVFAEESSQQKSASPAKSAKLESLYRLNILLHVLNGTERLETKTYTMLLREDETGKLRILTKIPIRGKEGKLEYIEKGVKCDAEYDERDGLLFLELELHYTDFSSESTAEQRLIQEIQFGVETILNPGASTIVSSLEGTEKNRRYEVEVNAEKVR